MGTLQIKRIYEHADENDGLRILVDRLWPRGIKKENAHIDEWMKAIAPSTELRKWFNHDTDKWHEFQLKYLHELKKNPAAARLLEFAKDHKNITLLYAAHDEQHNQAVVLKHFISEALK